MSKKKYEHIDCWYQVFLLVDNGDERNNIVEIEND
jgi:hypothetical protein